MASQMSKMYSTSLLGTPWTFWTGILSQVSKNDDEETLLLRVIWLQDHQKTKIKEFPNEIKEFSLIGMSHKIKEK